MSEDEAEEEEEQEKADEEEEAKEEKKDAKEERNDKQDSFSLGGPSMRAAASEQLCAPQAGSRSWPRSIRAAVVCAGAAGCLLAILPFSTPFSTPCFSTRTFARFATTFAMPTVTTPCPMTFLAPLAAFLAPLAAIFKSGTLLGGIVRSSSTRATLPDDHGALQPHVVNVVKCCVILVIAEDLIKCDDGHLPQPVLWSSRSLRRASVHDKRRYRVVQIWAALVARRFAVVFPKVLSELVHSAPLAARP